MNVLLSQWKSLGMKSKVDFQILTWLLDMRSPRENIFFAKYVSMSELFG